MTGTTTINDFVSTLSSKAPIPGGGGASAVGGALAAALGGMVASLTIGKKKYADVEAQMQELLEKAELLQKEFIALSDADEEVFTPLAACYSMPSGTEEEKAAKAEAMEKNLLAASLVPVKIMEKSVELMDILEVMARSGSRLAVSDAGVGIQFARTALLGAVMNVYINTKSMKNREKAEEINAHADQLVAEGVKKADSIYQIVTEAIR